LQRIQKILPKLKDRILKAYLQTKPENAENAKTSNCIVHIISAFLSFRYRRARNF